MRKHQLHLEREAGVVSIMITMVIMIVISLVVLGFAEITRNEQRSSLDAQLSAQAYYAAESGVNDVRAVINATIQAGNAVQDKTICGDQGSYILSSAVDAAHNVSYTCVLVDASPKSLFYNVGYISTVIPVISTSSAFGTVTLEWKLPNGVGSVAGCYTSAASLDAFLPASGVGAWPCAYPVLRVDMVDANGSLARANWSANTATVFFVPFNSGSISNNTTLSSRGDVVGARCDDTSCKVQIDGLGGTNYYMRVTTLYRTNSSLIVSTPGANKSFANAQATIDSTGKAQDVLRRILVAVDLTDANVHKIPSGALITKDSICKRYGTTNTSFDVYDDLSIGGGGDTYCNLQTSGAPTP